MSVWDYGVANNGAATDWLYDLMDDFSKDTRLAAKKEIHTKIRKALSERLPETPTIKKKHWKGRRRRVPGVVKISRLPYPPIEQMHSEPLVLRVAAWCVYCFSIEELRPLAIGRLRALLNWEEWIAIWKEPKKIVQALKKQIRQLEG